MKECKHVRLLSYEVRELVQKAIREVYGDEWYLVELSGNNRGELLAVIETEALTPKEKEALP